MGADAGFDMVPKLGKAPEDTVKWELFIAIVKDRFQDNDQVELTPKHLVFKAGEHPRLPWAGHQFLRFSSCITGKSCPDVFPYISAVCAIARRVFGSGIQYWNELRDQHGHYSWTEVYDARRSYDLEFDEYNSAWAANDASVSGPDLSDALFIVKQVQNKGRGVFARVDIRKGTQIMCEKPFFKVQSPLPAAVMESTIAEKLKTLPKADQRQVLSLHNNFPGRSPFSGIFRTNALSCGSDSSVSAIYPTICFINHDCLCNTHNNWNDDEKCETIFASRDITAGEELTICYAKDLPFAPRRQSLQASYGFQCECGLCSSPLSERRASDKRREQIMELDGLIGNGLRIMRDPAACLADCHNLISLLEAEFGAAADSRKARTLYDAFQICVTHSDEARASTFASRGYDCRLACEGPTSPHVLRIKSLSEDPQEHLGFGMSNKWKSKKSHIPKNLSAADFERWLWKLD